MSTLAFDQPRRRRKALARPSLAALTARPELIVLLAIAGVLNLWALDLNGWANDYYAAAVRSMTHVVARVPLRRVRLGRAADGGQAAARAVGAGAVSARAFGFNSWSLLVPQALMGVATVGLVYDLARSRFGRGGGIGGGPDARADADHGRDLAPQQPGRAARAVHHGGGLGARPRPAPEGSVRWLMLGRRVRRARLRDQDGRGAAGRAGHRRGVAVGRAARAVLAPSRQLLAGGAVMAAVGLAWPLLMWLTPASSRPYVSGTDDNSIWSLILGYNGLGRLFGQSGGPGGGGMGGGGGVVRRLDRAAAAAQRGARRAGGLVPRLRGRRRPSRWPSRPACAATTPAPAG